jgi:NAD(P)-dependent dehydrogenase (short-subunit alcohol dehydrogenase family)
MQKIALITGANRGLGLETARQLARDHGFTVYLGSRDETRGLEAQSLLQSEGLDAHYLALDVTDSESIQAAATQLESLDMLINNAGIMLEHDFKVGGVDVETWKSTFAVNLFGPVEVTNAFLPLLENSSEPRIVNLSAILGSITEISKPQMKTWIRASYSSSKAALNAFTVALAQEKAGTSFKINAAHPGWAKTDMGGPQALVAVDRAVKTIIQLATLPEDGPTGGFFHVGKSIAW